MNLEAFATDTQHRIAAANRALAEPVPGCGKKILVAEDHQTIRNLMFRALASEGFEVKLVTNGEEAWDELFCENYDLLVTDNEMPRLKGLDLVKRMRAAAMELPVILASGSVSAEITQNCPQLNIAAVLAKPFNLWDFLGTVRNTLGIFADDLPVAKEVYANSPALRPTSHARTTSRLHHHVLIADDDAVVRGSLAAVLKSEGYEVDEAANGIEAVTRAIRHKPDLVLLDLNMPHADGWTAFSQLEQIKPLLPVIIITARPNQYPEAVRVGVDAFMEKPLNIAVLVNAVKRLTNEDEHRHDNRITKRTFVTQLLGSAV
jgi:CheY-like chemotaxis protein